MLPDTRERLKRNALVVCRAAAAALRPDPRIRISDHAERYRIVPDMGAVPGKWKNEVAPELVEPMDAMSPDDPTEHGIVMKPSQSGGSAIAENWLCFIMHLAPGPAMYIGPTVKAAKDWKTEKLDPTIEATPVLNPAKGGVVAPQKSRSGEGSTSDRLRFKGGFLIFAGANSAASLRQHSIRYMVRDDRAGWTDNADGEGDPRALSDQRLKTYRVFGLAKKLDISSPGDKGDSFDQDFERSDKRRYYLACLRCGDLTDHQWADIKKSAEPPYRCHLLCPSCGHAHYDHDKPAMKAQANGACWIPTAPDRTGEVPPKTIAKGDAERWRRRDTGRSVKGWHLTGVISTFERWDLIAKEEADAGDDPLLLKPFVNTVLGEPYEARGDGPVWETISARREHWMRGDVPAGVIFVILSVDVQADGLYWERTGWGPNKENWLIDYGYLAGPTDAPHEGAWAKLDAVVESGAKIGAMRVRDDLIGVDSGYNVDAVYAWVKRHYNALALKGEEGWSKPAIFRSTATEIAKAGALIGKSKRYGLRVWLVGTYGLKGAHYVYISRSAKDGQPKPAGLYHFPADAEEEYFRHQVSEYVAIEKKANGEPVRIWRKRGPNHWLDCRIMAWALTHYAGLWNWSPDRWTRAQEEFTERLTPPKPDPVVAAKPQAAAREAQRGFIFDVPSNFL